MNKTVIGGGIGVFVVIAVIILFTNTDEVISESIKIDTSTFNQVTNSYPIDSYCDVILAYSIEWSQPDPSQWYLDNFSKEHSNFMNTLDFNSDSNSMNNYFESLKDKTDPEFRNITVMVPHRSQIQEDPQCYQIFLDKYPQRIIG